MLAGRFLLFAGGEPHQDDDARRVVRRLPRYRAFTVFLPSQFEKVYGATDPAGGHPWEFPADVRPCLELVLELAKKLGRTVKIVDVNRPEDDAHLVGQWVGPSRVLPLLIAPSGARLEGLGAFSPGNVRSFLARG